MSSTRWLLPRTGLLAAALLLAAHAPTEATYSIVAVDPETGEVGGAVASCVPAVPNPIIADPQPGVGFIITQAFYHPQNQEFARQMMNDGASPQEIADAMAQVENDAEGNPGIRQYGIVDLTDGGRSAAFTGGETFDYNGQILGPTYAIQGNTLLGAEILEGMEQAFLNTAGSLADKLMAALVGGTVVGSDVRCAQWGFSSLGAGIIVAKPDDQPGDYYLDMGYANSYGFSQLLQVGLNQELYDIMEANPSLTSRGPDAVHALADYYQSWKRLKANGRRFVKPGPIPFGLTASTRLAGKLVPLPQASWAQIKAQVEAAQD